MLRYDGQRGKEGKEGMREGTQRNGTVCRDEKFTEGNIGIVGGKEGSHDELASGERRWCVPRGAKVQGRAGQVGFGV